jgi:hypothetical protein
MAASHLVAGEDVEHGGDEEAEPGGNEDRVEHGRSPFAGKLAPSAYRNERGR